MSIEAREALDRLREGNRRFAAGASDVESVLSPTRRISLATQQRPFAIVLGCSDSRVPAELVFDQGLGDLFVIRVAGNIVAPSQVGSVEFAAAAFGTSLAVVLGHTRCGAIQAALDEAQNPAQHSPNLRSIVDRILPAVQPLVAAGLKRDEEELMHQAVRANVRASASHLRHGSALLEQLVQEGKLLVVGAEYSLETGEVDFFDGADGA